jgi:hypothetical protein
MSELILQHSVIQTTTAGSNLARCHPYDAEKGHTKRLSATQDVGIRWLFSTIPVGDFLTDD